MHKIDPTLDNLELSHNILDVEMLSYNDQQMIFFLKHLCDQQLGIKNSIEFVADPDMDVLPTITGIICSKNQSTTTMEESKSRIAMTQGDILIFPSEMNYSLDGEENCRVFKVGYIKNVDINSGSKKFIVTATLKDQYNVEVSAENEEDAIAKAKNISISKWNHLDLYPDVKERKVIRYAKWNNFDAKPID
jgi:hypothetical protein